MKIALVSQPWDRIAPPVETGSVTLWIYEMARGLAASCDVIVYSRRFPDQQKEQWAEGVRYRRVSVAADLLRVFKELLRPYKQHLVSLRQAAFPSNRPLFASALYYWTYIAQIAYDLRTQDCDVVHLHNFSQFLPIVKLLNKDVKTVLQMHCEWLNALSPSTVERRLRSADLIIGCGEYITEQCRKAFPAFAGRCKSLRNGVNVTQFSPCDQETRELTDTPKRLLFTGRVSPEKGVHVLLEAFHRIVARYPLVELEIVGANSVSPKDYIVSLSDDPIVKQLASFYGSRNYHEQLLDMVDARITGRVFFMPWVPHSQLAQRYRNAAVFVAPSVWNDPYPFTIVEAMAAGLPVVATRSGGVVEIVDEGRTGLLVDRGDVSGLAEAVVLLLENDELRNSMGRAARQRAIDLFTWEKIVECLVSHYTCTVGQRSGTSQVAAA